MKKIINILLLVISIIVLSGCTLGQEDELDIKTEDELDIKTEDDFYILSAIEFNLFEGDNMVPLTDVSEYFFITLNCKEKTVFDNCLSVNFGKSIDYHVVDLHYLHSTDAVSTATIDLTFYTLKDSDLSINHTFIFENSDGYTKEQGSQSTNFVSGISLSGEVESNEADGKKHILIYTFHYEAIDLLETVTIKQFDETDNLLEEVTILQDDLLDELVLNDEASYYVVIEEYSDSEGEMYQNKIYHDTSVTVHYLYKFTNEQGFLTGDKLYINQSSE